MVPAYRRPRPLDLRLLQVWLGFAGSCALLVGAHLAGDIRTAALGTGLILMISIMEGWRVLRLRLLSPAMAYLCVFGVFHLGFAVPWALGIHAGRPPAWMHSPQLTAAVTLVALALTAYQAGTALGVLLWPKKPQEQPTVLLHNFSLYGSGLTVFLVGVLSFLWGVRLLGFEALLQANYVETHKLAKGGDPRLFVTSFMLAPIGLYLAAAAVPRRRFTLVLSLLAAWSAVTFFLGFRGFALIPVIVVLAVMSKRGLRFAPWFSVAGLLALLAVIPLGRAMRDHPLAERSFGDAVASVRPLAAIEEMGGSLGPLVHTLRLMETESLRWGATYWRALQRVVPNLSMEWQGGGYVPLEELPPEQWVTRQAAPWKYHNFGGLGFSAVAEPYMNFGAAGVVAYFFFLALSLVSLEQWDGLRPTRLAMWAVLLGPLLWTARGSFESLFRPCVWGLLAVAGSRILAACWSAVGSGSREPALGGPRGDRREGSWIARRNSLPSRG